MRWRACPADQRRSYAFSIRGDDKRKSAVDRLQAIGMLFELAAMRVRVIHAHCDWPHQALTDARPASRISCDSARSSTARAMTMAPTNVAYVLMAFCLRAAFDLAGTSVASRSIPERT